MTDVPFPYIVGVDRSGTTLLRAMLASHPDLAIPDEANFRLKLSVEPEQYEEANGLDLDGPSVPLMGNIRGGNSYCVASGSPTVTLRRDAGTLSPRGAQRGQDAVRGQDAAVPAAHAAARHHPAVAERIAGGRAGDGRRIPALLPLQPLQVALLGRQFL